MVIILALFTFVVAIGVTWALGMYRYQTLSKSPIVKKPGYQLNVEGLKMPAGIYFSPTHSWVHLDLSGKAKVGIDSFLQGLTGILSAVFVPEVGSFIKQADPLFSISHKGKKLVISAPVSGTVTSINTEALQNLRGVHKDPFDYGWLLEISPSNWETETQKLYLGVRATNWLKSEFQRVRDFFAYAFMGPDTEAAPVLLQEGGDVAECALAFSDDSIWEAFQASILDEANKELNP